VPRMICGVDDSPEARRALQVAGVLAQRLGSELIAVHVGEPRAPWLRSPGEDPHLPSPEAELLARVCAETGVEPARSRIESGTAAKGLREVAGDERAELVVIGSRGRGRIAAAALGSVARALGASAPCPVVVVSSRAAVPFREGGKGPATVVCGVDGSDEARAAATVASRLSQRLGLRLILAHARQDAEGGGQGAGARAIRYEDRLDSSLRPALRLLEGALRGLDRPGDAELRIGDGPPGEVLEAAAEGEDAALVVVGSRGPGPARAALLGSVSARLATSCSRPVVIVPSAAKVD
jgi:nucleotide-binding universal stress UspA family protein